MASACHPETNESRHGNEQMMMGAPEMMRGSQARRPPSRSRHGKQQTSMSRLPPANKTRHGQPQMMIGVPRRPPPANNIGHGKQQLTMGVPSRLPLANKIRHGKQQMMTGAPSRLPPANNIGHGRQQMTMGAPSCRPPSKAIRHGKQQMRMGAPEMIGGSHALPPTSTSGHGTRQMMMGAPSCLQLANKRWQGPTQKSRQGQRPLVQAWVAREWAPAEAAAREAGAKEDTSSVFPRSITASRLVIAKMPKKTKVTQFQESHAPHKSGKLIRTWQMQVPEKLLPTIHPFRDSIVEAGVPPVAPHRAVIPHPNHAYRSKEQNNLRNEWAHRLCGSTPQSHRGRFINR